MSRSLKHACGLDGINFATHTVQFNVVFQCNTGSSCSITHVNESEKTQVAVDWIAPAEPEGDLVFK